MHALSATSAQKGGPWTHLSYGVFAVRTDVRKVLVIQQKSGNHWTFCKGHIDEGETPLETATRELQEETGLSITRLLSDKFFAEHYTYVDKKGRSHNKKVELIPADVEGEVRIQEEEILDYKWVAPEDIDSILTYKEDLELAQEILKEISL